MAVVMITVMSISMNVAVVMIMMITILIIMVVMSDNRLPGLVKLFIACGAKRGHHHLQPHYIAFIVIMMSFIIIRNHFGSRLLVQPESAGSTQEAESATC